MRPSPDRTLDRPRVEPVADPGGHAARPALPLCGAGQRGRHLAPSGEVIITSPCMYFYTESLSKYTGRCVKITSPPRAFGTVSSTDIRRCGSYRSSFTRPQSITATASLIHKNSVINKTRTLVRPSLRAKLRPVIVGILHASAGPSRAVVGRPCGAPSPYRDGGLRNVGGEDHLEARSHQKETIIEAPILVANLVQSG
jgi:hypothetical protein